MNREPTEAERTLIELVKAHGWCRWTLEVETTTATLEVTVDDQGNLWVTTLCEHADPRPQA